MVTKSIGQALTGGASLAVVVVVSTFVAAQTPATNPASKTPPEDLAKLWRDASAKYDGQRSAILKEVDRSGQAGPLPT